MELAQLGNAYFDAKKARGRPPKIRRFAPLLRRLLQPALYAFRNLALAASPIIPAAAQKIWHMLGFDTELAKENWQKIRSAPHPTGQRLREQRSSSAR